MSKKKKKEFEAEPLEANVTPRRWRREAEVKTLPDFERDWRDHARGVREKHHPGSLEPGEEVGFLDAQPQDDEIEEP